MKNLKTFEKFINESIDIESFETEIENYIDNNSDYISPGSLCSKVEEILGKEDGSITDKTFGEGGKTRISVLYNNEEFLGVLVNDEGMLDCGPDDAKYHKQYRLNQGVLNKI